MAERVSVRSADGIATIRMERPEKLNAIDQQMWRELVEAARGLARDPGLRVAVITGAGRAFCVGADLKETAWRGETQAETRRRIERNQQQLARELLAAPVPIIAAVNGYALGGGVEIALAADLRIASATAQFGFPETNIGRFITGGASLLLPAAVGLAQAKRLVYTARRIDAAEALRIGLVEEVVAPEALEEAALALARAIAANAPVSVALAKRAFNRVALGDLETALTLETEGLIATYATSDNDAGVAAFAERGKAEFKGN